MYTLCGTCWITCRKANDDCLAELRWLYVRHNLEQARQDLGAWLGKWQSKYPKMCSRVEANIEETFTFYRLPTSTTSTCSPPTCWSGSNEELKRRTLVVRIFPNAASCLRLVRAGGGDPRGLDRSRPLPEHRVGRCCVALSASVLRPLHHRSFPLRSIFTSGCPTARIGAHRRAPRGSPLRRPR
jgi:hypothetical protein